jgi:hypothetical protein
MLVPPPPSRHNSFSFEIEVHRFIAPQFLGIVAFRYPTRRNGCKYR